MSRFVLRTVLSILCLAGVIVFSFSCVCSPSECEEISEDDCPAGGGTVWDPCKCCRVCARIEGEPCGGPHGFHGTCAKGFDCVISSHATGKPVSTANSEGICTRQAKSQANCETPSRAFGCNIIGNKCWCEKVFFCTEDSPFMFATAEECQVNLEVMLRHELADLQQSGLGSQHFLHPEPHEGNRTGREAGGWKAFGGVRTAQEGPQYPPKWRAEFSGRQ